MNEIRIQLQVSRLLTSGELVSLLMEPGQPTFGIFFPNVGPSCGKGESQSQSVGVWFDCSSDFIGSEQPPVSSENLGRFRRPSGLLHSG